MKYRAVPFNEYSAYLVHAEHDQSDNDIIITQEQYEYLLNANNNKQAEIRVIELDDQSLSVKDFYDQKPSQYHEWNRKAQQFEISEENNKKLEIDKNIAFLSSEINRAETKLTQLYRLRDRNKASESHLSQIEELEDYSTDLMLVEDQEGYPLNAVFPTCPDFFSE